MVQQSLAVDVNQTQQSVVVEDQSIACFIGPRPCVVRTSPADGAMPLLPPVWPSLSSSPLTSSSPASPSR